MYILGMITLTFFAIIGLASFITAICRRTYVKDDRAVLVLRELTADNAEHRVRRAAAVCEELRCERLICECADDTAAEICDLLSADYPVIEIQEKE